MRLFERFHSSEAHKTFVDNVLKAKRLRKEIAKLQTYRRLGITSLADAEKYELDKSRREYHKMAWLKKEAEMKKAEAEAARQAKENASADLGMMGLDGGIGAAANQSLGIWKQYSQDSPSKRRRIDDGAESAADVTAVEQGESQPTESAGTQSETAEVEMKPASDSFALEDKPGFDMLSSKEKELCKRLQLLPQDYLAVKKALISKSLEAGIMGTSQKGKTFVTVDVSKSNDIIDFVLKAGWISSRPAVTSIALKEDS
jgi:transcriptional adapter 2-alpha